MTAVPSAARVSVPSDRVARVHAVPVPASPRAYASDHVPFAPSDLPRPVPAYHGHTLVCFRAAHVVPMPANLFLLLALPLFCLDRIADEEMLTAQNRTSPQGPRKGAKGGRQGGRVRARPGGERGQEEAQAASHRARRRSQGSREGAGAAAPSPS